MLIFLKLEEIICFYQKMNCLRIFLLMIWDCVLKQWILKSNMRTKHEKIKKFFWMWYFIFHLLQNNSTFFPAAASALPISSSPLRESLLYTLPGRTEKKFGTKRIRPGSYSWYSQRLLMEFILSGHRNGICRCIRCTGSTQHSWSGHFGRFIRSILWQGSATGTPLVWVSRLLVVLQLYII